MVQLLFWPAIIISIIVSAIGIIKYRLIWLFIGAVLTIPFSLYLNAAPRFHILGVLPTVFILAAAFAVHRRMVWLGWLFIMLVVIFFSWLRIGVLQQ